MMVILCLSVTACKDIGLDDEAQNALSCLTGQECDSNGTDTEKREACYFYCDGDFDCGTKPQCKGGEDEYGNPITANYCGMSTSVLDYTFDEEVDDEPFLCGTSSSDEIDENDTHAGTTTGTAGNTSSSGSSYDSGSTSGSSTASVDYGDSTGGIGALPVSKKGSDRYFMGTYELSSNYIYDDCTESYWGNGYEFPGVIRAYSYGNKLDFEDNSGNLVWNADVFPDDTFDFSVQFLDSFGRPSNTVACTCYIEEPYSYSYDTDTIKCTCDPSYEEDDVCSLTYDMM